MTSIHKISFVNFTRLNEDELTEILAWRNRPAIRSKMANDSPITLENHLDFCHSLKHRTDVLMDKKEHPMLYSST